VSKEEYKLLAATVTHPEHTMKRRFFPDSWVPYEDDEGEGREATNPQFCFFVQSEKDESIFDFRLMARAFNLGWRLAPANNQEGYHNVNTFFLVKRWQRQTLIASLATSLL